MWKDGRVCRLKVPVENDWRELLWSSGSELESVLLVGDQVLEIEIQRGLLGIMKRSRA